MGAILNQQGGKNFAGLEIFAGVSALISASFLSMSTYQMARSREPGESDDRAIEDFVRRESVSRPISSCPRRMRNEYDRKISINSLTLRRNDNLVDNLVIKEQGNSFT